MVKETSHCAACTALIQAYPELWFEGWSQEGSQLGLFGEMERGPLGSVTTPAGPEPLALPAS